MQHGTIIYAFELMFADGNTQRKAMHLVSMSTIGVTRAHSYRKASAIDAHLKRGTTMNNVIHHMATYGNFTAPDRLVHLRPVHPVGCTGVLERFLLGLVVADGRLDSVFGEPGRVRPGGRVSEELAHGRRGGWGGDGTTTGGIGAHMEQCSFTGGSFRCCAMTEFWILTASSRFFPLSHSVVNDELAIAEPHPNVCAANSRGAA